MAMELQRDETFEVRPGSASVDRRVCRVARQAQGTQMRNVLGFFGRPVLLEVEDAYFHHNSAVMMPDTMPAPHGETLPSHDEDPEAMRALRESHPDHYRDFAVTPYEPPDGPDAPARISGLAVLAATYRFLALNPPYRLLLAGHADTSGDTDYNFHLSELRAKNVLHLLRGERPAWVDVCLQRSMVEDHQRILKHFAAFYGWPCDPGSVDGVESDETERAVYCFQELTQTSLGRPITADGKVGRETWGAFYDAYMDELASILQTTVPALDAERRNLRFVDDGQPYIACGEQMPIDAPERDEYRSQENRRVELLFFRPPSLPDLSCHRGTRPFCMRACPRGECGVYAPGLYRFQYLEPGSLSGNGSGASYQPHFEIRPLNEDVSFIYNPSEDAYRNTLPFADLANNENPWSFLEPFHEHDPDVD